jgi:hypothetical protein
MYIVPNSKVTLGMSNKKTFKKTNQKPYNKTYKTNKHNVKSVPTHSSIEPSKFIGTSRLNRGQRKYCHCLMQVRTANSERINQSGNPAKSTQKLNPYAICRNMSYKIMLKNRGQPAYKFKPEKTNCIMNYDYTQYSLADIQALAKERNIPVYNNKTGRQIAKSTLIQLLTSRYIKNHRISKNF